MSGIDAQNGHDIIFKVPITLYKRKQVVQRFILFFLVWNIELILGYMYNLRTLNTNN